MRLLIVESPSKMRTISKYLGKGYKVISSYGHIRAIPSKSNAVDVEGGFVPEYSIIEGAETRINNIVEEAKKSDYVYLATDPDREGEAISWHISEILKEQNVHSDIFRIAFYEITKPAVLAAVNNPRKIDENLVKAQQTRQILDYLVGFTISPVLWRKLKGSRSAGRVQSVALRMLCDREEEIESFVSQEYWSIIGYFIDGDNVESHLVIYNGNKLEKFDINNKEFAQKIADEFCDMSFYISDIKKKKISRTPPPPFYTSTLIQQASSKLGFSPKRTMVIAQKLYEGINTGTETSGLITYMRTDSPSISSDAKEAASNFINKVYGKEYQKTRDFKSKSKNAQEAHEAIRPTDINKTPDEIERYLDKDQHKLYKLIWNRFVASQMSDAILESTSIYISSKDDKHIFKSTGSKLLFKGFYKLNAEDIESEGKLLPDIEISQDVKLIKLDKNQHFTEPPPRYSEASLVKKMEEVGIGRPSTYSSIVSILQDRGYALLENGRFKPEARGRVVSTFLAEFFSRYVEYDFTATMEEALDNVASGEEDFKRVLTEFWIDFKKRVDDVFDIEVINILASMEERMNFYLYGSLDPDKSCPECKSGKVSLKTGKFGIFLGCSAYPGCGYIKNIGKSEQAPQQTFDTVELGNDEELGMILLKKGPYGFYVQCGSGKNIKRASIQKDKDISLIDLSYAKSLLIMPKSLGFLDSGHEVKVGKGRFGPYIEVNKKFTSIRKFNLDPITMSLEDAIYVLNSASSAKPPDGIDSANKERKVSTRKRSSRKT